MISNKVTDWIYNTPGQKVTQWNQSILNPPLIGTYADAVHTNGAALDNCFCFIDGTVRPISRPMSYQRIVYNGHKRVHALSSFLLLEGRMHDARMLAVSQLYDDLQNFAFDLIGRAMRLYGDPAYPLRVHLQALFRDGILTRDLEMLNESMSAVRSSVEWLFGDIINYFKFLDLKKIQDWTKSSRENVHSMFYFKECFDLSLFKHNSKFLD